MDKRGDIKNATFAGSFAENDSLGGIRNSGGPVDSMLVSRRNGPKSSVKWADVEDPDSESDSEQSPACMGSGDIKKTFAGSFAQNDSLGGTRNSGGFVKSPVRWADLVDTDSDSDPTSDYMGSGDTSPEIGSSSNESNSGLVDSVNSTRASVDSLNGSADGAGVMPSQPPAGPEAYPYHGTVAPMNGPADSTGPFPAQNPSIGYNNAAGNVLLCYVLPGSVSVTHCRNLRQIRTPWSTIIIWPVPGKQLNSKDRHAVSPGFKLPLGNGTEQPFKMMLIPRMPLGSNDKKRCSFKESDSAYLELKCDADLGGIANFVSFVATPPLQREELDAQTARTESHEVTWDFSTMRLCSMSSHPFDLKAATNPKGVVEVGIEVYHGNWVPTSTITQ